MSDRLKKWVTGVLTFALVMSLAPTPALAEIVDEAADQSMSTSEVPIVYDEVAPADSETSPDEGGEEAVLDDQYEDVAGDETADMPAGAPSQNENEVLGSVADTDVAKIGETGYATLKDAVDAANNMSGDVVVELLADVTWTTGAAHGSTPLLNANSAVSSLTINGNGHTLTAVGAGIGSLRAANDGTLSFNNMTIKDESKSYAESSWEHGYLEFGGKLNFTDVDFVNAIMLTQDNGQQKNCDATFTSCTFNSNNASEYDIWVSQGSATFNECEFTGYRGAKTHEAYGSEVDTLTFTKCNFKSLQKKPGLAVGAVNPNTTVIFDSCMFDGVQKGDQGLYVLESDTARTAYNLIIKGTANVDGVDAVVARIGERGFLTVEDAFATVKPDETLEILKAGTYKLPSTLSNITVKGDVDGVVFEHTGSGSVSAIPDGASFENVGFNFGTSDYHGFQHAGTIDMVGCTINGKLFSYADMNFDGCTFNAPGSEASGTTSSDYAMWAYAGNIKYTDCTFNGAGKFVNVYNEDGATRYTVDAVGCTFNSTNSNKAAFNVKETCGAKTLQFTVNISNCKAEGSFPEAAEYDATKALWVASPLVQVDDRVIGGTMDGGHVVINIDGTQKYSTPRIARVAAIGTTEYVSLTDAFAEAKSGDTIVVYEGVVELPAASAIPEGVIIKGAGTDKTTLKISTSNGDGVKLTNPNITIQDVAIDGSAITNGGYKSLINVEADGCVVDNVVFSGGGKSTWNSTIMVERLTSEQTFTVKNSTITGSFRGVLREGCNANIVIENSDLDAIYPFNIDGGIGGSVTVRGSKLHGWTSYSGVNKVTFTDCEFCKGNSGYDNVAAYVDTEFKNCTFDSDFKIYAQTSPFDFTLIDCTKAGTDVTRENFQELFPDDSDVWNKCDTYVNSKLVGAVAEIVSGERTSEFKTLQAALDAAHEMTGDVTVTLVKDITEVATVHQKDGLNLTVDGGGKTIAGQLYVDGDGRYNGADTLTIQNVKFAYNAEVFDGDTFINVAKKSNGYNYAHNLTVKDCEFAGEGATTVAVRVAANAGANKITLSGNTVTGGHSFAQLTGVKDLTITGNEVTGVKNGINISGGDGTATISGNKLTANETEGYAVRIKESSGMSATLSENNFSGGDCIINQSKADSTIAITSGKYAGPLTMGNSGKIVVTGGLFTDEPARNMCGKDANGNQLVATTSGDADYPYTVGLAVATIGDQGYGTLKEAVAAAQPGDTIKLLVDLNEPLEVKGGKKFTLDLNKKTLTGALRVYDADVTVANGTLKGTVYANGSATDQAYGHVTIASDATVEAGFGVIVYQAEVGHGYGATVDINGTVNGIVWVMGNIHELGNNPSTINVNSGAKITGNDVGIALNGAAVVNVADGATVTGMSETGTGIEVRAGKLNVTGGTITGEGTATTVAPAGSGTTTSGAGIAIAQHTTKIPIEVNVTGGTIKGATAIYESDPQENGDAANVKAILGGGTFLASADEGVSVYSADKNVVIPGDSTAAFSDDEGNTQTKLPEGKRLDKDVDGLYRLFDFTTVEKPVAITGLIYNAAEQTGVPAGEGYTIVGNTGTNAGTYTATATLKARHQWSDGTVDPIELSWAISAASIEDAIITNPAAQLYTGEELKPAIKVRENRTNLVAGVDYTVAYSNNINAGVANVTVTGTGNYTGKTELTFAIHKATLTELGKIKDYAFKGSAIEPELSVSANNGKAGNDLKAGTDYKVIYLHNTNVGEAAVIVTGTGNYIGMLAGKFNITELDKDDLKALVDGIELVEVSDENGFDLEPGTKYTTGLEHEAMQQAYNDAVAVVDNANATEQQIKDAINSLTSAKTVYEAAIKTARRAVASVDDTKYATLQDAIDAAGAGDTVCLLADVDENVVIAASKNVILDLGGNTVTGKDGRRAVYVYGELSVAGEGKINSTKSSAVTVNGGTLVVESGTISAQEMAVLAINGGDVTVNGGTLIAHDNAVIGTNGTAGKGGNKITVNGGELVGTIETPGYVACGIYVANDDTVVVNGGEMNIIGGAGIVARAGNVTVDGGTITTFGTATGKVGDSAVAVPCSAIVFDTESAYPGLNKDAAIAISGGTFVSEADAIATKGDQKRVSVSGGEFSNKVVKAYCADGLEPSDQLEDGLWTVKEPDGVAMPETIDGLVYNAAEQTGVAAGEGYKIADNTGTNAGTYTATATLDEGRTWADGTTDPIQIEWKIARADVDNVTVGKILPQNYTGSKITPNVALSINDNAIDPSNYTVLYVDNVEEGTATAVVIGKGNLTGVRLVTFDIVKSVDKSELQAAKNDANDVLAKVESGKVPVSEDGVTDANGKLLADGQSYTTPSKLADIENAAKAAQEVLDNESTTQDEVNAATAALRDLLDDPYETAELARIAIPADGSERTYNGTEITGITGGDGWTIVDGSAATATNVGTYEVTARLANAQSTLWEDGTTEDKTVTWSIVKATEDTWTVAPISDQTYTGSEIEPVKVKIGETEISADNYDVVYVKNTNVGEATAVVVGKGNLSGAKLVKFNIVPNKAIELMPVADQIYTGSEIKPELEVKSGEKVLVEGIDYVATLDKNVEPGEATVAIEGIGNYAGAAAAGTFKIATSSIANATVEPNPIPEQTYTGEEVKPEVTVAMDSRTLTEGKDYKVEYSNNVEPGEEALVKITGLGGYDGELDLTFKIVKETPALDTTPLDEAIAKAEDILSKVEKGELPVSEDGATDSKGNPLADGDEYITPEKLQALKDAVVEAKDALENAESQDDVNAAAEELNKTTDDSVDTAHVATPLKAIKVADQYWTGRGVDPKPEVTDEKGNVLSYRDYDVVYAVDTEAENNTNASLDAKGLPQGMGKYKATATGKGDYSGTVETTFEVHDKWERLWGQSAVDTMQSILRSDGVFTEETVDTVVIASRREFQAALTGTGLAGLYNAPLLITDKGSLSRQTREEIERLKPKRIIVAGNTNVISASIYGEIQAAGNAIGATTTRVSGGSASSTAVKLYQNGRTAPQQWGKTAIVATQASYKDALSIAPYAYAKHAPIFLTESTRMNDGKGLSNEALNAIKTGGFTRVIVVGGKMAVPDSVISKQLKGIECKRIAGANAIATSTEIAYFEMGEGMTRDHIAVATTRDFADALTGAALAGAQNSVLVLSNSSFSNAAGSAAFDSVYSSSELVHGHILGGTFALDDNSETYFRNHA